MRELSIFYYCGYVTIVCTWKFATLHISNGILFSVNNTLIKITLSLYDSQLQIWWKSIKIYETFITYLLKYKFTLHKMQKYFCITVVNNQNKQISKRLMTRRPFWILIHLHREEQTIKPWTRSNSSVNGEKGIDGSQFTQVKLIRFVNWLQMKENQRRHSNIMIPLKHQLSPSSPADCWI